MKRIPTARLLPLLLALALSLGSPHPVQAAGGIPYGDSIPAGTLVDHDVLLTGQNVSIDGTVEGNVFILGNQVVVNGQVDGNIVLVAQNAAIGGQVSGTIYALALTLDLPQGAVLGRDLYIASVSLTSKTSSQISRHLYALGLDAGLNGPIGGELHTLIGPIQLYNGLMRLLGFDELTLELHFEAPTDSPQGAVVAPGRHLRLRLLEPLPAFDWGTWGMGLLRSWGILFLFALLAFWLARKPLAESGRPLLARPWRTLSIGLLVLVVSFNLFIVALLLVSLVFGLGLGLNFLGLWQLTVAVWVFAFALLLVAVVALWLFIAYGAKLCAIYLFFTWLFELLLHRKAVWLSLLALLAGTIAYSLLRTIPYAGWAVDLLVTAAGMGSSWLALRQPSPVLEPAPVRAVRAVKKAGRSGPAPKARSTP